MAENPKLIVQVPRGGAVDRQMSTQAPASVASGEVLVELGPADDAGSLEPPDAGQVVLSVPSPEALRRDPAEVRRVIAEAGKGVDPVVVVVEAAEELREDELAVLLAGASHVSRAVILRVMRDG